MTAKQTFTNNAVSTLASGITNVATSLSVQAGHGARFPSPTGGDWFLVTLIDSSNVKEIVKVTGRATDVLTIVRAQEGTASQAFSANDRVFERVTKGTLETFLQRTEMLEPILNARDFGATGDGVTDDTAALIDFFTAAEETSGYMPPGTYLYDPSAGIVPHGGVLFGAGRGSTILKITGNGDVFSREAGSVFRDLLINMQGATFSGHCCRFPVNETAQADSNIDIINAADTKQALLFALDGGGEFCSIGSGYHTLSAVMTNAAVKVDGTDTQAIPRTFIGANGYGCTIYDVGGCGDFFIYGGFSVGIMFPLTTSRLLFMMGVRCPYLGTMTVKGDSHKLIGNVFGGPVILAADTQSLDFNSEVPSYDITDNGTGNQVAIQGVSFTPVWTAASVNPVLGNGTLAGVASRVGRLYRCVYDLTIGSTTTVGTGAWFFSLPRIDVNTVVVELVGIALLQSAAGKGKVAAVRVEPGLQKVSLCYEDGAGDFKQFTNALPVTWAAGDIVRMSFSYLTP